MSINEIKLGKDVIFSLKGYFLFLTFVLSFVSFSSDLIIADKFEDGDIVSAETFNEIFDTIEKINRTVKNDDLLGTWTCDAFTTRATSDWIKEGFYYVVKDAQVNFTLSSSGSNPVYTISTSYLSPFKRQAAGLNHAHDGSFSATFLVSKNKLFTKHKDDIDARIWDINFVSPTRFELTFLETSAESFPAAYASFLTCDSALAVPAPPISPSAINAQTSINVSWTGGEGELGFRVYRKRDGDPNYSLLTTTTSGSYSDSSTVEGLTYFYYVVAFNDNGESAKSKVVSATLDSINPFVVSTLPADGDNYLGTTVTITFNEVIEIKCPESQQSSGPAGASCNALPAIELVGTGGSGNTYYMGQVGANGISISGAPFVDGANPNYSVTVSKDHIFDLNGNQMEEDFTFSFTDG